MDNILESIHFSIYPQSTFSGGTIVAKKTKPKQRTSKKRDKQKKNPKLFSVSQLQFSILSFFLSNKHKFWLTASLSRVEENPCLMYCTSSDLPGFRQLQLLSSITCLCLERFDHIFSWAAGSELGTSHCFNKVYGSLCGLNLHTGPLMPFISKQSTALFQVSLPTPLLFFWNGQG